MSEDSSLTGVLSTILTILVINYLYKQYIESTKDVSDVYLTQQSTIDAIRLPNESAIYKSNKLDYSHGLRIGLDIRYDHYKLRNGNFCDVWEVLVNGLKANPHKDVTIDDQSLLVSQLNHQVHQFMTYLKDNNIKIVTLNHHNFILSFDVFVIVFACFISQITINIYDDFKNVTIKENTLVIFDKRESGQFETSAFYLTLGSSQLNDILDPDHLNPQSTTFVNEYHFSKDKGVSIQITRKINPHIISNIEFTQANIISSVASTIKHLPASQVFNQDDIVVIIQDLLSFNNENLMNDLVKILVTFISGSQLILTNFNHVSSSTSPFKSSILKSATIISINESHLRQLAPLQTLKHQLNWFDKLRYKQLFNFLSRGKFIHRHLGQLTSNLRITYLKHTLNGNATLDTTSFNEYRSLFGCRLIIECGYSNVVGPIIQTDFYDYRLLSMLPLSQLKGYGCLSQSDEIKLINCPNDKSDEGDVMVRGYNIGKTSTQNALNHQGSQLTEEEVSRKNNDGFMPLNNIRGKWGLDGCLYIYT